MPFGRSKDDDDYFICPYCSECALIDEEGGECVECYRTFCSDDCLIRCNICEDGICIPCRWDDHKGCEACGDEFIICSNCLEEHLQTCTKVSRAERLVATERRCVERCEEDIARLQREIKSKQSELSKQKAELAAAQKRKMEAESSLAQEKDSVVENDLTCDNKLVEETMLQRDAKKSRTE